MEVDNSQGFKTLNGRGESPLKEDCMEIAMCPICGGAPLDKWEVTSVRVIQTGQTCCGVDCSTNEIWNQYAAAMNFALATRTLESAMEPLNSGKLKMGDALPAIRLAMEDQKSCEQRVLEVFHA